MSKYDDDSTTLLGGLTLVAQFLEDPTLPELDTDFLLSYAVDNVLINHITEQYTRLRVMFGLAPPNQNTTLTECENCIVEDASTRTASDRLLAWSWLYHHYVRDELNISSTLFAKLISRHNRTLHRNRQDALHYLVRSLSDAEQIARNQKQQVQLLASIPGSSDTPLYGRGPLLQKVIETIIQAKPAHFVVSGGPGTGKTAFIQHVAHYCIETFDSPLFDALIWIYNPTSVENVRHQVCEHLNLPLTHQIRTGRNTVAELRAYLLKYDVLIVIDCLDSLDNPSEAANEILQALGAATVFMITQSLLPVRSPVHVLMMRDLYESEVAQLCQDMTDLEPHLAQRLAAELIAQIGGNPYALRLALNHYSDIHDAVQLPYSNILTKLFHLQFERLDAMAQRLWCACALMPDAGLPIENLTAVWPSYYFNGITALLSQHILRKVSSGVVILEASAQRYIRSAYEQPDGIAVQQTMDEMIHHLVLAIRTGEDRALPLVENVLRIRWPSVPGELAQRWFAMMLQRQTVLTQRTFEVMHSLHRAQFTGDPDTLLAFGVGLRRRGHWEDSEKVLLQCISLAGQLGNFGHHARSFLELAILLLHSGKYEQAIQVLNNAEVTARRYKLSETVDMIRLEHAQIAIDIQDPEQALDMLQDLPESGRSLAIRAEAYLQIGSIPEGLSAVMRASRLLGRDTTNLCRLQVLIGRLRLAQRQYGVAEAYFSAAIVALEAQGDLFAMARAQSNLGAALLHLQKFHRADQVLRQAYVTQRQLGDDLGLIVTQENLTRLDQLSGKVH